MKKLVELVKAGALILGVTVLTWWVILTFAKLACLGN